MTLTPSPNRRTKMMRILMVGNVSTIVCRMTDQFCLSTQRKITTKMIILTRSLTTLAKMSFTKTLTTRTSYETKWRMRTTTGANPKRHSEHF
jgi:hypothetical protein